jgi:hypothetical protein
MYGMILMTALAGSGDTASFGGRGRGCSGCDGVVVAGCTGSCHGGGFLGLRGRRGHSCHGSSCQGVVVSNGCSGGSGATPPITDPKKGGTGGTTPPVTDPKKGGTGGTTPPVTDPKKGGTGGTAPPITGKSE